MDRISRRKKENEIKGNWRRIKKLVISEGGDKSYAEDIADETCIKATALIRAGEYNGEDVFEWMGEIALSMMNKQKTKIEKVSEKQELPKREQRLMEELKAMSMVDVAEQLPNGRYEGGKVYATIGKRGWKIKCVIKYLEEKGIPLVINRVKLHRKSKEEMSKNQNVEEKGSEYEDDRAEIEEGLKKMDELYGSIDGTVNEVEVMLEEHDYRMQCAEGIKLKDAVQGKREYSAAIYRVQSVNYDKMKAKLTKVYMRINASSAMVAHKAVVRQLHSDGTVFVRIAISPVLEVEE